MNKKLEEKLKQQIITELRESAVFNKKAKQLVEKFSSKQNRTESNSLLREAYEILSTIRNRDLITDKEQEKLEKTVVGFWGLSVGSNAALAWMLESRAETVKLVDPDIISPSNLNRLQFEWEDIGKAKVDVLQKKLLGINPYAKVICSKKTDASSTEKLFDDTPKIDVVVDEIDDLIGKVNLRKFARKRRLPLIMCTDIGDNVCIDIERYDLDPNTKMFFGRVPEIEQINLSSIPQAQKMQLIVKIVSFEENSEALLDSFIAIGKTIKTWPQLAATAFITGGAVATTIKKIICGEQVKSGRYYISLDNLLVGDFNSKRRLIARRNRINKLKERFSL